MMALPDADSLSCVPRALLVIVITASSHWAAHYLLLWMLGTLPGGKALFTLLFQVPSRTRPEEMFVE